jgi:cell division protein FtsI (penicillin-binding protein 3)
LVRALTTVTTQGTGSKVKNAKSQIAGKTGTAWIALDAKYVQPGGSRYVDSEGRKQYQASFVGFFPADEPRYTAIVTIYSKPTKASIYGGTIPALTIKELVDKLYAMDPSWSETTPNSGTIPQMDDSMTHIERGGNGSVPSVVGYGLRDAIYAIENSGYKFSHTGTGHVVSQSPKAGEKAAKGETVKIVLK